MLRLVLLITPLLLFGCATPNPLIVGDAARFSVTDALPVDAPAAIATSTDADAATGVSPEIAADSQRPPAAPPPGPRQRFSIKGGYYGASDDGIDDGYIINLSWRRPTSGIFSTEVEIGYLDASGTDKGVDRDLWAIPVMGNGRFDVPVGQKIELYGGLGLGSFYYDVNAKAGGVKVSGDGFLFGGNAFFGGSIHLGQELSLGLEGKYYVTDSASDLNGGLDAYVVLLTLGFDR